MKLKKFFASLKKLFKEKKSSSRRALKEKKTTKKRRSSRKARKHSSPTKKKTASKPRKKSSVKSRKSPLKKTARRKGGSSKKKSPREIVLHKEEPQGELVGEITHFFSRIQVVVIKMTRGKIRVGDQIRIKGHLTDFQQRVGSLQINSVDVKQAQKGHLVGLKVDQKVREGDRVFRLAL